MRPVAQAALRQFDAATKKIVPIMRQAARECQSAQANEFRPSELRAKIAVYV